MSDLQFSLFFVAIIVGYLLVHARLVRFESHLAKLGRLEGSEARLEKIQGTIDRMRTDGAGQGAVGQGIEDVRREVAALREGLSRVERVLTDGFTALQTLATPAVDPSIPATPQTLLADTSAADRIRALVETRLLELGYRDLRILGDLADARLEERTEVRVEATRQHMPVKGVVAVRNAAVVDIALQSAAKTFP